MKKITAILLLAISAATASAADKVIVITLPTRPPAPDTMVVAAVGHVDAGAAVLILTPGPRCAGYRSWAVRMGPTAWYDDEWTPALVMAWDERPGYAQSCRDDKDISAPCSFSVPVVSTLWTRAEVGVTCFGSVAYLDRDFKEVFVK